MVSSRVLLQRIKVIDPISVQLNPYHRSKNSNSLLLLKPNSEHKLSLSKDFTKVLNYRLKWKFISG